MSNIGKAAIGVLFAVVIVLSGVVYGVYTENVELKTSLVNAYDQTDKANCNEPASNPSQQVASGGSWNPTPTQSEAVETESPDESEYPDNPLDVVRSFHVASMIEKDFDKARSYWGDTAEVVIFTPADIEPLSQYINTQITKFTKADFDSYIFHGALMKGANNAEADVQGPCIATLGGMHDVFRFLLVKTNGQWKIMDIDIYTSRELNYNN